ncbi:MAG: uncharacterized protein JWN03_5289 [Nocardia sp.]|uniref:hypothetical protein n=1 Tax=Nocardia sp. TaxID=1821 RepID=UPI0026086CD2|nr:hypothetical protein [Nocardia sp.]MCU1645014.1 uncharacterized protein [Nocardia sp.]
MRFLKHATRIAVAGVAMFAASLTTGATATAASTPEGTCGAGYYEIDHHDLPNGTIHLMYNGSTDCVVTWKTQNVGTKTYMMAGVGSTLPPNGTIPNGKSATWDVDAGQFAYYAGPVYWYAPGACIAWFGVARQDSWTSQMSHCG